MREELLRLLNNLVKYKTIAANKSEIKQCFAYISKELSSLGLYEREYFHNGVLSKVWLSKKTLKPDYLLNAHIDVVPASDEMFKMKISGNRVIGRGVSDMKFAVAGFIVLLKKLASDNMLHNKSIGLMITSDEEVGGVNGVGYLVNQVGYRPKHVFIPDGGNDWKIVEKAKGVLQIEILVKGKSAHASKLWEGESAIDTLATLITKLRDLYPIPSKKTSKTTLNFGSIQGGTQTNQVCDLASVRIDIRYESNDSPDEIIALIESLLVNSELEVLILSDSFSIDSKHPFIKKWESLISDKKNGDIFISEEGASDGRYFSAVGSQVILSKPIGGLIHTEEEWLDIDSFVEFTEKQIILFKSL